MSTASGAAAAAPAAAAPAAQAPAAAVAPAQQKATAFSKNAYHLHLSTSPVLVEVQPNHKTALVGSLPAGLVVSAADAATLGQLFTQLSAELAAGTA